MQKILLFVFFVFMSACDNKETSGTERLALGESAFIVNNDSGQFSMAPFLKDIDLSEIIEKHQGGDAKSAYFLGVSLMYGYDIGMNKEEGVRILESAWKGGVVDAGYDLYEAYYYGGGASVDCEKSLYYLIVSAENGYINSQREIAFAYKGKMPVDLVEVDYEAALRWFIEAANGGDKISASNVAQMFYDGDGVSQDEEKVFEWMSKIEGLPYGNPMDGFSGLAKVYEEGIGTDIDLVQAYKYYDLLSPGSAPDKARLEEKMTPEQICEAIRLSRQWQEEHNIYVPSYYGLEYQEDGTFQ
ncbi:sel1 repeat family protein [Halomonas litopenaei]|nr:sel1 repeat family protein [Halomonas litopenaei]